MFKNIIAPVQAWLLAQGRCVGCGLSLKGSKKSKFTEQEEMITCKKCQRVYIYHKESKHYRRAPFVKEAT